MEGKISGLAKKKEIFSEGFAGAAVIAEINRFFGSLHKELEGVIPL